MKKVLALITLSILIVATIPIYNVSADSDDYFPWTWGVDTTELSVQDFTTTFTS